LPTDEPADHGSVNYLAGTGVSLLGLDVQATVLGIPTLEFGVDPGHSQDLTFAFGSLISAELLGDYQIVVQRWDSVAGQWTTVDGLSEGATILDIGLLDGDVFGVEQELGSGDYRAFVTFEGVGLSLLNTLAIAGIDFDNTQIKGYEAVPVSGNVMDNDPVTTPETIVQSVEGSPVTGVGTVINGQYGTLSIDPDGSFTYTPFDGDGDGIGEVDSFGYTLLDTVTTATTVATLYVQIGSDGVAMTWDSGDPGASATAGFSASDDVATADVVWTNATDDTYFDATGALLLTGGLGATSTYISDSFAISDNMEVSGSLEVRVLLAALSNGNLFLERETDPGTWTVVASDSFNVILGGLGTVASIDLSGIASFVEGTYRVRATLSGTLVNVSASVVSDIDVVYLDQFEIDSISGHSGNLLANDDPGSEFTMLQIFDGTDYVDVDGSASVTVTGAFGSLTVDADGNYAYTPDHTTGSEIDTFSYQLVHPTGAVEQGSLTVTVEPSGEGVIQPFMAFSMMLDDPGSTDDDGGSDTGLDLDENDGDVDLDALGVPKDEESPIIPDTGGYEDDPQSFADLIPLDDDLESPV